MAVLFILITYLATSYYHDASTQLLNKDVAAHIAKFTSPFTSSGISREKADSVFQDAMVLSPAAEVYFLDTTGKVLYFHASEKEIREWQVDLATLTKYISTKGAIYLKATDPKDPANDKIFSAAEVNNQRKKLGYIYVIFGSKHSENIVSFLFGSHVLRLAIQAFIVIILFSLILSLIYLKRVSRNFQLMIGVLERFEAGEYTARFDSNSNNELQPVTTAFNKMADLLSSSIEKLKMTEQERKDFIATISHDLRTPLSIARGYAETLALKTSKAELTAAEKLQYSQLIYNKIVHIENMVKQLFELTKIDAIEFKPSREPFVLSEIVQESVDTFQMLAAEKNVNLRCSRCNEHIWVNADVGMMERVIQNLTDNALKNTFPGGSVDIEINSDANLVIFKITNDGAELSQSLYNWIKDFNESVTSVAGRPKKAGLGLLIVQKILHLHNSILSFAREDNKNIFSFALPIVDFTD
ncbi:MAG: HAMP domain-containing sensor histidine kinase [Ferruginibacter sp.]